MDDGKKSDVISMPEDTIENLEAFFHFLMVFLLSGFVVDIVTTFLFSNLPTMISYLNEIFVVSSNLNNSQKQISEIVVTAYYLSECAFGSLGYYALIKPFFNSTTQE